MKMHRAAPMRTRVRNAWGPVRHGHACDFAAVLDGVGNALERADGLAQGAAAFACCCLFEDGGIDEGNKVERWAAAVTFKRCDQGKGLRALRL